MYIMHHDHQAYQLKAETADNTAAWKASTTSDDHCRTVVSPACPEIDSGKLQDVAARWKNQASPQKHRDTKLVASVFLWF